MARRKAGLACLRTFLKTYFPWAFPLKWSADHLRIIEKIQRAALEGGLFALAMPRGSGKTTICSRAALWAILRGSHSFVCILAANEDLASKLLKRHVLEELRGNDLLFEDFQEVCHPIRALGKQPRRATGQRWNGVQTSIVWGQKELAFPIAPQEEADGRKIESFCRGALISCMGITSSIRGQSHLLPSGKIVRPSFVLIDDPQDRESANGESMCANREAIIAGDVLGMAGPGQKISAVMPCTVIRKGDMADKLLDRQKHPDWSGERTKMLYSFPENQKLWDEYAEIRATDLAEGRPPKRATAFYRKHRRSMDAGAVVAWPQRKSPDDVSAIQHAMNLLLRDRGAFFAEYQNEPLEQLVDAERLPTADEICAKLNRLERATLDVAWSKVTGFVDVQKNALFWCVCGWSPDFSGGIVDYGVFPDAGRPYFAYDELGKSLLKRFPGRSAEAAVYAGLQELTQHLATREWKRNDGAALRLDRILVDSGWEGALVSQFCRQSPLGGLILPSKGVGISAGMKDMNDYQKRPGETVGMYWRLSPVEGRGHRLLSFDANFWKWFLFQRLAAPMGGAGCLSLYGNDPRSHRLLGDHLKAEYTVKTHGRGRDVVEWKLKPGKPDNHLLDAAVGCCVGAATLGCWLGGTGEPRAPRKPRVPLSQMGR